MTSHSNFVHLHNHTEYSFLDGAIRISDMIRRAGEFNMPALGITDHGGLFGAIEFYDKCLNAGIKPVLGFEAYVAPRARGERSSGRHEKNTHLILLARNNTGWKNLMRLSSIGYREGFYYKPRVDMEVLEQYSDGIIATSACVAGAIPRALLAGDREKARFLTEQFLRIFGEDNFYFELQNHGIDEEIVAFKELVCLGKEMGVPFIVANDAHYLDKEDARSHEVLLCLQTQTTLDDPKRFRFTSEEVYFKSPEEMARLFPDLPEALSNTVAIAERCNVKVHANPQLPVPEVPEGHKDGEAYLRHLAEEGLCEKYDEVTPKLRKQLDYELGVICSMGFVGYFLIVRDFVLKADELGVMRGCRGSAAGSLVAYCIGITQVDPIRFGLIFERFLNPERISLPDADIDFADHDRYKIIDYVVQKYGRESVCQIINFGRMMAKMIVRDVARVMGMPIAETNRLAAMVGEKTLKKSISANGELARAIEGNSRYRELFRHGQALEGLVRQPGMHAGGVIIAPGEVVQWSPLFKQPGNDIVMTQFDMKYVESVGLVKMDFLGLRTLTVLQESTRLVEKEHGVELDLWKLPDRDPEVCKLFGRGETVGIFQFESQGMRDNLRKLKPEGIEDLIAMNALYRPGPMEDIPTYIHRKHGKEKVDFKHDMLREILEITYGVITYQEQVMRVSQVMGGFSPGQADILRRAMGKKDAAKMEEMRRKFVDGALEKGVDVAVAEEIFDRMARFAEYGFNKAHATVYAHMAYQAGYLKAHYTIEYMTALLTSHMGKKEDFLVAKNETERMKIPVLPPDVNMSELECSIEDGGIRLGLCAVANVGKAADALLAARADKGKFASIFELCRSVDMKHLNRKTLESLVSAGALDSIPGTRAQLFEAIGSALEYGGSFQRDRLLGQTNLFGGEADGADAAVLVPEPELPDVSPWPYSDLLAREKEALNFYVSGHPLDHYRDEISGLTTTTLGEQVLREAGDSASVLAGGVITALRSITQKNGKPMAFLDLDDFEGSVGLVVFGEPFEQYRHLLAVDSMVLVRGTLQKRETDQKPKLLVEKVMALSEAREKLTRSVHVRFRTNGLDEELAREIRSRCAEATGECRLIVHVVTREENEYRLRARKTRVSADKEVLSSLREKLGDENVWLSRNAA